MQVWKFGGTSVGKPERMKSIRQLITEDGKPKIVVLSALSGSTNTLLSISESLINKNTVEAQAKTAELRAHYDQFLIELYQTEAGLNKGKSIVEKEFNFIAQLIATPNYGAKQEKEIVALGELLSTQIFEAFLQEEGVNSVLLPALDFMVIDADNEPILSKIEENIVKILSANSGKEIYITQGFICRNPAGEIDNLKRGGSDYTASLIGGAISAEEVQIWTDIDGMHNNDPRIVKNTFPIRELSFEEAAELAYFGAKILHPSTITPAKMKGVPVRLKNTMEPSAYGTLISDKTTDTEIKAIAAKDNITAIYIHSTRMLNAYGFLKRVFEVFEKYKTPVDMITTSEVSVSVTVDQTSHLEDIMRELREFAELEDPDANQVIICIVGNFFADKEGIAIKVLDAMRNIPIRMISYGASEHNISLLVDAKHKNDALNALNEGLF
ncbi:MAG: Aspartate kinase [Bacteroidota bacterium]|jgi:aspartate kinase